MFDIEKLKKLILESALHGRLVEQHDENDNPDAFLREILDKKQGLAGLHLAKQQKNSSNIEPATFPFVIPSNWRWVKLGDVLRVISGTSYDKADISNEGIRILRGGNIQNNRIVVSADDVFLPSSYYDFDKTIQAGDTVIVASTGSSEVIGKPAYAKSSDKNSMIGAFLRICRPIEPTIGEFINILFQSDLYRNCVREKANGTNINNIKESYITELYVPFPPYAEQKRIVDLLDNIFSKLDCIKEDQTSLFVLRNNLQDKLFEAAIRGELVEQSPAEGTGEELFKDIIRERAKLKLRAKNKKGRQQDLIFESEKPFSIPKSWKWVPFGTISSYSQRKEKLDRTSISPSCWSLDLEDIEKESAKIIAKRLACDKEIKGERYVFKKGQILFGKLRPYLKKILIAPDDGVCSMELIPFDMADGILNEYAVLVLRSNYVSAAIDAVCTGVTLPRVSSDFIDSLPFPLPPYEEQKRIIDKLRDISAVLPSCEFK